MKIAFFWFLSLSVYLNVSFGSLDPSIDPVVYKNKYGSYYLPLNHDHRPAIKKIKMGEVYERETLEFIEVIYKPHTHIVHAGAYFGDMLPFFSKLVGEQNKVWAFEPIKLNYECAKATLSLNGINNVILMNNALSSEARRLPMRVIDSEGKPCGGSCSIIPSHSPSKNVETVQTILLDELLPEDEPISLIHLDVEGHEIEALTGALKIIEKNHPVVILEVWDHKKKEINHFMKTLHYKAVKIVNGNTVYIHE
jgi:FkbM family methyltransferase